MTPSEVGIFHAGLFTVKSVISAMYLLNNCQQAGLLPAREFGPVSAQVKKRVEEIAKSMNIIPAIMIQNIEQVQDVLTDPEAIACLRDNVTSCGSNFSWSQPVLNVGKTKPNIFDCAGELARVKDKRFLAVSTAQFVTVLGFFWGVKSNAWRVSLMAIHYIALGLLNRQLEKQANLEACHHCSHEEIAEKVRLIELEIRKNNNITSNLFTRFINVARETLWGVVTGNIIPAKVPNAELITYLIQGYFNKPELQRLEVTVVSHNVKLKISDATVARIREMTKNSTWSQTRIGAKSIYLYPEKENANLEFIFSETEKRSHNVSKDNMQKFLAAEDERKEQLLLNLVHEALQNPSL